MTDTVRTVATLLGEAPDNTSGTVTPQIFRDTIVSLDPLDVSRGSTGALAATYDRAQVSPSSLAANTSGVLNLVRILLPKGLACTNIAFFTGTTASATSTHNWFALFDSALLKLAITADDTATPWAASTKKSLAIAGGPFVTTYSGVHYLGICTVATTMPTLAGFAPAALAVMDALAPLLRGSSSASLTTPATCPSTAGAITATQKHPYAEIS